MSVQSAIRAGVGRRIATGCVLKQPKHQACLFTTAPVWTSQPAPRPDTLSCSAATLEPHAAVGDPPGSGRLAAYLQTGFMDEEVLTPPATREEACALLERLQAHTAAQGTASGLNVVAFSGGVDSSLAAYLVHSVFEDSCCAALGVSASLPQEQAAQARHIADFIGIELWEVPTPEGESLEYVANEGGSCLACKSALYSTLRALGDEATSRCQAAGLGYPPQQQGLPPSLSPPAGAAAVQPDLVLFNGTNADDLTDPTRLGLLAAASHSVASPLAQLPKAVVRQMAQLAGLPNWDWAASPCLRSRLELGVPATEPNLKLVGAAERVVRSLLCLTPQDSLRVRVMKGGGCYVEVEESHLSSALALHQQLQMTLEPMGLSPVGVRLFRSGALSGGISGAAAAAGGEMAQAAAEAAAAATAAVAAAAASDLAAGQQAAPNQ